MAAYHNKVIFFLSLFMAVIMPSCKKTVDKIQQNAAYEIITNGRWEVTKFDVDASPKIAEYAGYEFQFYRSGVVTAFKTGTTEVNGTWLGKQDIFAIESNFPLVGDPLKRFNGTWIITATTETSVKANKTNGSEQSVLWLQKK